MFTFEWLHMRMPLLSPGLDEQTNLQHKLDVLVIVLSSTVRSKFTDIVEMFTEFISKVINDIKTLYNMEYIYQILTGYGLYQPPPDLG